MTGGMAGDRLISSDLHTVELGPDTASVSTSIGLANLGRTELGLWESGPGTEVDTETDEVFVVLSGAGSVEFADGSVLHLRLGTLARLHAGDRTTWRITERLRKLYLI